MTINDTRFGPQDTPQGKHVGASTDRQAGHGHGGGA